MGTAGQPVIKRRRADSAYFRERVGWYVGTDMRGGCVLRKIAARQPLARLASSELTLAPAGAWSVASTAWRLGEPPGRREWDGLIEPPTSVGREPAVGVAGPLPIRQMSWRFRTGFMALSEQPQQTVLAVIASSDNLWGDSDPHGWDHEGHCSHLGPCEHIILAVVGQANVLALNAERYASIWRGCAGLWPTDPVCDPQT